MMNNQPGLDHKCERALHGPNNVKSIQQIMLEFRIPPKNRTASQLENMPKQDEGVFLH